MNKSIREYKEKIVASGEKAIEQLIKVAGDSIELVDEAGKDLDQSDIKNAVQSKKMAIFDALEILERIELVQDALDEDAKEHKGDAATPAKKRALKGGFAEGRAKG